MNEKPEIDCTYIPLSEDNLHWFIPLFKRVFKKDITLAEVKRKYDHSFINRPYMGVFAVHNNLPIGFSGICYCRAVSNGKVEWACNYTDSMVLPGFRGLNVYITLLSKVEQLAKDNGISFSISLPNDNSFYPMVNKDNWNFTNRMMGYLIPIKTLPFRRMMGILKLDKFYLKWAARKLEQNITPFDQNVFVESDNLPHMIHDELFFQYKASPAHFFLKVDDQFVWIKLSKQLAVGFLGDMEEAKLLSVIESLKKMAKKLYIQQLMLQFTKGSAKDLLLKKHFQCFESWPIIYKNQGSQFNLDQLQLQYCDLDSF